MVVAASAAALPAVAVLSSSRSGWGRSGHRHALLVGAVVLIVVLGVGIATWAATASGNSGYRLASVTRTHVGQSLTVVGTVEPVNDASASFQVAGKVATVSTTVGQQVTAGQPLGTLDTTALSESVSSAQSTLNSAEAKLVQDEAASPWPCPRPRRHPPPRRPPHPRPAGRPSPHRARSGTQDQAKTAADQQQEAADLVQAQKTCGTGSTTTTTSTSTTTTTNPASCESALSQVSKDQQQVSADQAAMAKDEAALSQALGQGSSAGSGSPTPGVEGTLGGRAA